MPIQILNSRRVTDKVVVTEISGHVIKVVYTVLEKTPPPKITAPQNAAIPCIVDYRLVNKNATRVTLFVLTPNGIEAYKEIEFAELPEDLRQAMDQILVRFKNQILCLKKMGIKHVKMET